MPLIEKMLSKYRSASNFLSDHIGSIAQLLLRLTVARVFLNSGLTKWSGPFQFNPEKYDLFLYEFFCPDPARAGALQLCSADTLEYVDGSFTVSFIEFLAVAAGIMEVFLPLLLIFGLLTRFSAFGLLVMTLFIQLAVYPSWEHWWNPAAWWAISLFVILTQGPGKWSLDNLLKLESSSQRNSR